MIFISKVNNKFYLKVSSTSTYEFNTFIGVCRKWHLSFDDSIKGYIHANPRILLDTLYELADEFETFVSDADKEAIQNCELFVASFKPKRRRLNQKYFEDYPPLGQFQVDDVHKMFSFGRCINACKQGLGKTYSAIQAVNQILDTKEADVVLVVAIPAVLYNWKREFLRFSPFFKEEDFQIVTEKERDIFTWEKIPPVLITTYDTLRLISDFHFYQNNPIKRPEKKTEEQIKAYKADLKEKSKGYRKEQIPFEQWGKVRILFLDEAHKIKNMSARRTKIVHMHKHYFDFRYPMTGTPTPQGIQDIYSLVKVLDDNLIEPDYYSFLESIAVLGTDRSEWAIDHLLPENVAKFEERIKPYIIRRFLRDHVNIPQVHEKRIYAPLEHDQEELYKMIINDLFVSIKKENNGRLVYKEVQNKFPYISQILSDPLLLKGKIETIAIQQLLNKFTFTQNAKVKAVHNILDSIYDEDPNKDEKVLIWCEHPDTIDRLAIELKKYNPVIIHGANTPKGKNRDQWRDEQVQDVFKKDNKRKILIANPKCLGVGTNLQFCHNIIYYDRSYDFVDVDQSFSRVERAGLDKEAFYWYILIDNSLDIYQDKILGDKKLQDALFLKQSLSKADCQYIFMGKEYEKQLRDTDMEST